MKKSILLLFAFAVMCIQATAQSKPNPNGGIIYPALKKEIERKAAVKKILEAKVTKIELYFAKIPASFAGNRYKYQKLYVQENNTGAFLLQNHAGDAEMFGTPVREYPNQNKKEPYNEIYSFRPETAPVYKSLLTNGFTTQLNFGINYPGLQFKADIFLIFHFTDGNKVSVAFQGVTVAKEGEWKTNSDIVIKKNFPGSVFPDPENPLVLPAVK